MMKHEEDESKITIGYCFVNVYMEMKDPLQELTYEEIKLIKETYMYHKALEQLKRQDMIDQKLKECNIHPMPFNASQNKKLLKHEYPF